ncbi:MAG: hypothetical protein HC811_02510 [Flammeovirgaceae bacterium]|nr:hypothetical protein [Flammeovirgaceae bacterium]
MLFPLLLFGLLSQAQKKSTPLFEEEQALNIGLKLSIKDIKKITNDTTYAPSVLYYKASGESYDSIDMSIRTRGEFRLKKCYFPPLRIKMKKGDEKGTVFEGNKSLKLVVPCMTSSDNNMLIMREYLCYQIYEPITPYYFNTRLVNIDFTEESGKKTKQFQLAGFFIEDDDVVAERFNGEAREDLKLHPMALHDTSAIRYEFFQYMIANTDWSTTFQHNSKILLKGNNTFIPLAYDFDMAGFVNAPYATVSEGLGITKVTDRVYRGFCRAPELFEYTRKQYLDAEPKMMGILDAHKSYFTDKEFDQTKQFLGEFFTILKSDSQFKTNIVNSCRTK